VNDFHVRKMSEPFDDGRSGKNERKIKMQRDRIKWNRKYLQHKASLSPSRIVKDHYVLSHKGKALDIAAGSGRNSVFLARHGFSVEAVDISDVALSQLSGSHSNLYPICADLDTFDIRPNRYTLIVNIRFLDRRLFPLMIEGLAPGGMLIFEANLKTIEGNSGGPRCQDYLLRENELLHAFLPLRILYYREGDLSGNKDHGPVAALVAMKKHKS
jgi:SAM-dependent methyltransferase